MERLGVEGEGAFTMPTNSPQKDRAHRNLLPLQGDWGKGQARRWLFIAPAGPLSGRRLGHAEMLFFLNAGYRGHRPLGPGAAKRAAPARGWRGNGPRHGPLLPDETLRPLTANSRSERERHSHRRSFHGGGPRVVQFWGTGTVRSRGWRRRPSRAGLRHTG